MSHLYFWNDFAQIPKGKYPIGSTREDIQTSYDYWSARLLDNYDKKDFLSWLYKEYPQQEVLLDAYAISRYPVTAGVYQQFLSETGFPNLPLQFQGSEVNDTLPVWGVAYADALHFCDWLGTKLGQHVRLPTEEEWEVAAKGATSQAYPYGNSFDPAKANSIESGIGAITPVEHYISGASTFGVYDMAGNIEEWTSSTYKPYKGGEVIKDDLYYSAGKGYRVLKGGSFLRGGDLTRCARRHGPFPSELYQYIGFRVVYN